MGSGMLPGMNRLGAVVGLRTTLSTKRNLPLEAKSFTDRGPSAAISLRRVRSDVLKRRKCAFEKFCARTKRPTAEVFATVEPKAQPSL